MNRKEFIERLAFLLQDIDEAERMAALEYYDAYFRDAGKDNEQAIIKELGTPERVARIIKASIDDNFDQDIEYSESRMENSFYEDHDEVIKVKNKKRSFCFKGDVKKNSILLILIIIGAICLFSYLSTTFFSGLIVLVLAILFLGIGIFVGGFASIALAVFCLIKGILTIGSFFGAGLIIIALALGLIALALVFFILDILIIRFVPKVVNFIINVIRNIIDYILQLFDREGNRI